MTGPSLVAFDLDGTLIRSFMRESGGGPYDEVEVLPGRGEHLRMLALRGVRVAFITNQGGVAFGYQTEAQVWAKLHRVQEALFTAAPLYVAFDHPNAKLDQYRLPSDHPQSWRKPGPRMLDQAAADHGLNPDRCLYVGDMATDRDAARAAGWHWRWAADYFRHEDDNVSGDLECIHCGAVPLGPAGGLDICTCGWDYVPAAHHHPKEGNRP